VLLEELVRLTSCIKDFVISELKANIFSDEAIEKLAAQMIDLLTKQRSKAADLIEKVKNNSLKAELDEYQSIIENIERQRNYD